MKAVLSLRNTTIYLLLALMMASCASSSKSSYSKSRRSKSRTARTYVKADKRSKPSKRVGKSGQVRERIVAEALKHQGTKYVYGGKRPSGFDCSGFTSYVYNRAGVDLSGSSRQQANLGKRKAKWDLKPGDLAFFGSKGKVTHVAIVKKQEGGDLFVVHSTSSKGVRTDEVNNSPYWQSRFLFGRNIID